MAAKSTNRAGQATRNAILDQAARFFSTHGYRATSLADLLGALTLTKGAFYHHFKSKQALALELVKRAGSEYQAQLYQPALSLTTPRERISALLHLVAELNDRPDWCNCQLLLALAREVESTDTTLRAALDQLASQAFATWQSLLQAAQAAGDVSEKWPPDLLARFILNTIWGALHARKADFQPVDLKGFTEILEGFLFIKAEQ